MIVITGGHLTPALSLIDELVSRGYTDIIFIGRSLAGEETNLPSREQSEAISRQIKFIPLVTGKLHRHLSPQSILSLLKIPLGFIQSLLILRRYQPSLVVSFGGFLALPVALAAKLLSIPIITHEQGTRAGLANRIIAHLAHRTVLAWPAALSAFPSAHTLVIGNPLRQAILSPERKPLLSLKSSSPLIYFTGGNQGSRIINRNLLQLLAKLLTSYIIVHQTGTADYSQFQSLKNSLPRKLSIRYHPYAWLDDQAVSWCLHHASLVVSRAGANTITELAFTGVPALLIPLPKAQQNEQWHNANLLSKAGTAKILLQAELTPARLRKAIDSMIKALPQFRRHAALARKLVNPQARQQLADIVYEFLPR